MPVYSCSLTLLPVVKLPSESRSLPVTQPPSSSARGAITITHGAMIRVEFLCIA